MNIDEILNSNLSDSQKLGIIQILRAGKNVEQQQKSEINADTPIVISGKKFLVAIADSEDEKVTGLSQVTKLAPNEGMIFIYDNPQEDLWFTMEDTRIDLDIIFINSNGEVTSVNTCKALSKKPVRDVADNAQFVLEVNANSGIKKGDQLEQLKTEEDDEGFTSEDRDLAQKSKMLVLDKDGNVQMKLEGGERIFSRISTRKIIKQALKAYRDETDSSFIKLGKMVFKELDAQDGRDPEYVQK